MFVSLEKKILFFHISRAAGSSITDFLHEHVSDGRSSFKRIFIDNLHRSKSLPIHKKWRNYLDINNFTHMPQYDAKLFLGLSNIDTSDFFEFVIVRNPYDRFISQLYFSPENFQWSDNFMRGDYVAFMDEYLDRYMELSNHTPDNYFTLHQTQYIKYPITNNLHIYRYEDLDKLATRLSELLDFKVELPHTNQSRNKQKHDFSLNYDQKRRFYQLFKKDFELLGYDRDHSTI